MSGSEEGKAQELVIIRRRASAEDGGHHGGVWKIAYADFMTAMMAFFLVMWLINSTDKKTLTQVATYFNPLRLTDKRPAPKGLHEPDGSEGAGSASTSNAKNKDSVAKGATRRDESELGEVRPRGQEFLHGTEAKEQDLRSGAGGEAEHSAPRPLGRSFRDPFDAVPRSEITPSAPSGSRLERPQPPPAASAVEGSAGKRTGERVEQPAKEIAPAPAQGPARDFAPEAAGAKDAGAKQAGIKEAGTKEAGTKEAGIKEAGTKEVGIKEAGTKETGTKETGIKEAGTKEAGTKEAGIKEAGTKEAGIKEAGTKEASIKEAGTKEAGIKEAGIQEAGAQSGAAALARDDAKQAAAALVVVDVSKERGTAESPALPAKEIAKDTAREPAKDARDAANREDAARLQAALRKAVADALPGASPNVEVTEGPDGVLISLTDDQAFGMFAIASAEPRPAMTVIMDKVAQILQSRPEPLIVRGHTDRRQYRNTVTYDNWRLSAARAHMAYVLLARNGIEERRFERIEGYADRNLKIAADPEAAQNRRIEILLRKQTP